MNREHRLRTWPEYFAALRSGAKTFELRKDDRNPRFAVGDTLYLDEFNPENATYTGNVEVRQISYILRDVPEFGLKPGFCVIGFTEMMP